MNDESNFSGGGFNNNVDKKTFLNHVFSTSEDGKAEILNVVQYAIFAIIPVVILNKTIQRFIPDIDPEKSSLEITIEILLQIIIIFIGIIIIHRIITYFPTYSGYKYDSLTLTNVIIAFLIIVISIQTKIGIKTSILVDRLGELWNGPSPSPTNTSKKEKKNENDIFPHTPIIKMSSPEKHDNNIRSSNDFIVESNPQPANEMFGGSFGTLF
jgi:hypothetical protein